MPGGYRIGVMQNDSLNLLVENNAQNTRVSSARSPTLHPSSQNWK